MEDRARLNLIAYTNAGQPGQPATSAPQPAVMNQATAAAAASAAAQAAVDAVLRSPVSASPAAQTSVETMEQVDLILLEMCCRLILGPFVLSERSTYPEVVSVPGKAESHS